jgi:hypothetical protein
MLGAWRLKRENLVNQGKAAAGGANAPAGSSGARKRLKWSSASDMGLPEKAEFPSYPLELRRGNQDAGCKILMPTACRSHLALVAFGLADRYAIENHLQQPREPAIRPWTGDMPIPRPGTNFP